MRGVNISIVEGGLGRTKGTKDNIFGIIFCGEAPGLDAWTPTAIYSLQDAIALFITSQNDELGNFKIFEEISLFYSYGENLGKKLWIMLVPTVTTQSLLCDLAAANNAQILLNAAEGEISVLFISTHRQGGYTPTISHSLDIDCLNALPKAQAMAIYWRQKIQPFRFVLSGDFFNGGYSGLVDWRATGDKSCVYINLASYKGGRCSSQGLLAGKLATRKVHESIAEVRSGSLPINSDDFSLTSGLTLKNIDNAKLEDIANFGYISGWKIPQRFGAYFCDDLACTSDAMDDGSLHDGRTLDKAIKLGHDVLIEEYGGKIRVEADGSIDKLKIRDMETSVERTLRLQMQDEGEISFSECVIDPKQIVLSTSRINVGIRIVPTAVLRFIDVDLGFSNPAK